MFKSIVIALALALCLAGTASAKKYADTDGGVIEVSGEIQYTDEKGKPTGPKKNVEPGSVTIHGQPAAPVGDPLVAARVARGSAASGCATFTATLKKYSYLGSGIWQAWHIVKWCWSYPNITGTPTRQTDGRGYNGWAYDGVVSATGPGFVQWCCNSPRSGHSRTFRYGFHYPIWIVQSTYYPWITAVPHGNGTAWYGTGY